MMSLHQSGSKRKRGNFDVNCIQNHILLIGFKAPDDAEKEPMDPLQMEILAEKIISYLDVPSIKAARLVNKLWSIEGAKFLITKCHVQTPPTLEPGIKSKIKDEFLTFLSYKSCDLKIPNITVRGPCELKRWQSLGLLGKHVNSLKLNNISYSPEWLPQVLDLLPNLKYLCLKHMDNYNMEYFIKVLSSLILMSGNENRKSLIISRLVFRMEDLVYIEDISESSSIMVEDLSFVIKTPVINTGVPLPEFQPRLVKIMNEFLSTSRNILKKLTMHQCEIYLSFLEFPYMTALTNMDLYFDETSHRLFRRYGFSPCFRFSEKVPNLDLVVIKSRGGVLWEPGHDIFQALFENGLALSVKRLKYCDSFMDLAIDSLLQNFPNIEEFEAEQTLCSHRMLNTIWNYGRNLKKLDIYVDVDQFEGIVDDLDSCFTGFSPRDVKWIKNHPEMPEFEPGFIDVLRVNPSILNIQALQELTIRFGGGVESKDWRPPRRILAVAGQFAFKYMPQDVRIVIIDLRLPSLNKGSIDPFDEVSKLPNVIVR